VYSKTKAQLWEHLRALFSILAANRLALYLEKWVFAIAELDFLGHRISAASVAPLEDNVQVILDFPTPLTARQHPTMSTSFATTKAALVIAMPLTHRLPKAILSLATDASDTTVGADLQQSAALTPSPACRQCLSCETDMCHLSSRSTTA
jgi:hypothetical protein